MNTSEEQKPRKSTMTFEELKARQEGYFDAAKKTLLKHGHVPPLAFIFTASNEPKDWKASTESVRLKLEKPEEASVNGIAEIMFDLFPGDRGLLGYIDAIYPGIDVILNKAAIMGQLMGLAEDGIARAALKAFKDMSGMDEKDISMAMLQKLCKEMNAFATIMFTEAWFVEKQKDDESPMPKGNLEADPRSKEGILCALQTRAHTRVLRAEVVRKQRKDGRVRRRDSGRVLKIINSPEMTTEHDGEHIEGRMVSCLEPLDA